jgi:hypothetical protein
LKKDNPKFQVSGILPNGKEYYSSHRFSVIGFYLIRNAIRAPRGRDISCKSWQQEAALRMLMNNLDPEVARDPDNLIVYGGTGKVARNWDCFHQIVTSLR